MKRYFIALLVGGLALAACDSVSPDMGTEGLTAFSGTNVLFTGQGFDQDTGELQSPTCGEEADGGGTGVDPEGPYLLWVLTANGATSATLNGGPFGAGLDMVKVGGTYKLVTDYYDLEDLSGVYAKYMGSVRGNVQLVVSHGCAPDNGNGDIGAWCSPGYWGNRTEAIWFDLTGFDFASMFNGNVSPAFYENDLAPDQTIWYVIDTTPPVAGAAGPYGLDARNAAAAFLTSSLDGFAFDADLMDAGGQVCPYNAFGEPDPDFYYGWD